MIHVHDMVRIQITKVENNQVESQMSYTKTDNPLLDLCFTNNE